MFVEFREVPFQQEPGYSGSCENHDYCQDNGMNISCIKTSGIGIKQPVEPWEKEIKDNCYRQGDELVVRFKEFLPVHEIKLVYFI